MKIGPVIAAPSGAVPAAMRRLVRLPALSRRSRPVGMAFSRLARWRSAHQPPVMRAAPGARGRSGVVRAWGRPGQQWVRPAGRGRRWCSSWGAPSVAAVREEHDFLNRRPKRCVVTHVPDPHTPGRFRKTRNATGGWRSDAVGRRTGRCQPSRRTAHRRRRRPRGRLPGTASKALNGTGQLRQQTVDRVRAAADQLGFTLTARARPCARGRSFIVGVITTDSVGRFTSRCCSAREDARRRVDMALLLCDTRDDPVREQHHLRKLAARRVDGILVTGTAHDPRPPLGPLAPGVRWSTPSSVGARRGDTSVVVDDAGGAADAARHLLDLGRRRIAHVRVARAPQRQRARSCRGRGPRRSGRRRAHRGAPLRRVDRAVGAPAVDVLLARHPDLDGVTCGSDQVGRGVCDRLRELGRSVPATWPSPASTTGGHGPGQPPSADHRRPAPAGGGPHGRAAAPGRGGGRAVPERTVVPSRWCCAPRRSAADPPGGPAPPAPRQRPVRPGRPTGSRTPAR